MANEVGTATGLEDFFTKIVSFLTTNPGLVAAGQAWTVLRQRRDNLASFTTNASDTGTNEDRKGIHTCRYDTRSLNINSRVSAQAAWTITNYSAGVTYFQYRLRVAKEMKTVRYQCPQYSASNTMRNFRLQYSDDGTAWTTALTVNTNPSYGRGEAKDFAVPGTPGAHLYWKVIVDSSSGGSTTLLYQGPLLLLEADGTVANHFGSEVILKATGNGGTDSIYTGIRSEYDAAAGWYNLFLNGYTGYNSNEESWFEQPGAINGFSSSVPLCIPMVPLWNAAMPYWFSASGRSFRFGVKVSTSYEGGYLGFILPYCTPGQYPYPLAVGGSLVPQTSSRSTAWRYSYASWHHGVYPGPAANSSPHSDTVDCSLYIRSQDGNWQGVANRPNSGSAVADGIQAPGANQSTPYGPISVSAIRSVWPHCVFPFGSAVSNSTRSYRDCLGGGYMLLPCIIFQRAPAPLVFGELEGTYSISGYQNSPENTAVFNGKTHIILQNAYRNTVHEFWALSLD